MQKDDVFRDRTFQRIVAVSTGLAVAFGLGSLAALRVKTGVGLSFGWHWSLPPVVLAGWFLNWRFWNLVWQLQEGPSAKTSRKLFFYLAGFAALAVGSFLYPIQFIEQAHRNGLLEGLVKAALFLSTMFFLIYRAGKMFESMDEIELKRMGQSKV